MKGSFNVHQLSQPHGNAHWRVEGNINGKRIRAFYRTKEEAREAASIKNIELENHGHSHTDLSPYLRIQALQADEMLAPYPGVSIMDAVRHYIATHDVRSKSLPVTQTCQRFITDSLRRLENGEIGKRYHDHLVKSMRKFDAEFGPRQICDLTRNDIQNWLNCLPLAAESKNSHRRSIYRLFWQSEIWGLVKDNPVTKIKVLKDRRVKAKIPGILTLDQVSVLLECNVGEPELPVIAIGLFAGLRSNEINQLRWEDIFWEKRHIDCSAKIVKTASRRLVQMSDNLLEWLAPYRKATGKIFQFGVAKQTRDVIAAAHAVGIVKWPHNALRHSFGSYHLAMYQNASKTALQMGHENGETKTLLAHYTNARTEDEAKAYWNIRPLRSENITSFAA